MGFGANIRKLRTMEHLGQAQLAEMLGVSKETVCRWEKSRYAPRERHIEKLQALFGCTRDELVGEENGLAVKLANKRIVTDEDPAIREMEGAFPVIDIESQKRRITHGQQNACAPVDVAKRHPHSVFVKIKGDEMSRIYPPGSLLLVDTTAKPWNGCAVLALADGKTPVIRRFAEGNDMIVLSSHSYATASPDLMFNKRRIRIIGVVVWYQASHDHTLN